MNMESTEEQGYTPTYLQMNRGITESTWRVKDPAPGFISTSISLGP
jgi:hypothetical protein